MMMTMVTLNGGRTGGFSLSLSLSLSLGGGVVHCTEAGERNGRYVVWEWAIIMLMKRIFSSASISVALC